MGTPDIFDDTVKRIEAAYRQLGHQLGWRFLVGRRRTLSPTARTAFITLNPGGRQKPKDHGEASSEGGSAYLLESWSGRPPGESKLQKQVLGLFRGLDEELDDTLCAYFIPFRSPTLATLLRRKESTAFALELWRNIFEHIHPDLVVCIGEDTERALRSIWGKPAMATRHPVGWGAQTVTIASYASHLLVRFPHLSHFGVFGRAASEKQLQAIFAEVSQRRTALQTT